MHARQAGLWACNIVVPGSGLIFLHREWLGFCVAIIFSISANFTVAGALIAPMAWPRWLVILSGAIMGLSWMLAQALCRMQWRAVKSFALHRSETITSPDLRTGALSRGHGPVLKSSGP